MPHISVVVPVYKAENCLAELYRRLCSSLSSISDDFEIILVEDCGGDCSWEVITTLSRLDPRVKGAQFSRNFGQHYGITAGLDLCDGDWVVIMDCDLQDRPEEIPKLYSKALEGYDVVLANRGIRSDPLLKRITSWAFYKVFSFLSEIPNEGNAGNFRIISRKVVNQYRLLRENLRFFGGIINWLGFPTTEVEVVHDERFAGDSSYNFRKLLKLAVETIIAYSDKPLRLSIKFGFTMAFLAICFGVYIVYRALYYGIPVAGWSSLIVSLYFIGGIIIAILGIMGIYLGKTFDETKKRPLYVIRRTTYE
jgi:glycosyltransferase involved in cell wall biosynthesis